MSNDIRVLRGGKVTAVSTLQDQIIQTVTSSNLNIGGGGSDVNYTHNQSQPLNIWYVEHNLGKYPSVSIIDSAGSLVVGDVSYIDTNSLLITLAAGMSGKASLN